MKRIIAISAALLIAASAFADPYRVTYTLRGSGKKITVEAESSAEARRTVMDMFPGCYVGKDRLTLLIASDLDPSGETIANDFLHYLVRDCDMDEEQLRAWKFAITRGQVREFNLPPLFKAKPLDPTRRAFIEKHGDDSVYELDALTPAQLASLLEEAILDVIDVDVYESELAQEERDLKAIAQLKKRILK
jgi:hypothetical protein